LIIANENEIASMVVSRWQAEREVPAFTLLSSELWSNLLGSELSSVACTSGYDLVIVGPLGDGDFASFMSLVGCMEAPVVHLTRDAGKLRSLNVAEAQLLLVPERDGWLDELILLSSEVLRRVEAVRAARAADQAALVSQQHAALGRYMLDVQHNISNVLTSVLGNAELLLSESAELPGHAILSIETVQSMTLRLKEIMQRFSSLASELRFAEKQSQDETLDRSFRLVGAAESN
jgi:signal transduction histidine kinase